MHVSIVALLLVLVPVQRPADIVKWSASVPGTAVNAGGEAKITLTAKIENGWKLYALTQPKGGPIPLRITAPKGSAFPVAAKRIVGAQPKMHKDENFNLDTQYHENEASFTVPVTVPKSTSAGKSAVPLEVTFQVCGENICLRPFTQRVTVDVNVAR